MLPLSRTIVLVFFVPRRTLQRAIFAHDLLASSIQQLRFELSSVHVLRRSLARLRPINGIHHSQRKLRLNTAGEVKTGAKWLLWQWQASWLDGSGVRIYEPGSCHNSGKATFGLKEDLDFSRTWLVIRIPHSRTWRSAGFRGLKQRSSLA